MGAEEIKFSLGILSVNCLAVPSNSYSKRMNIQNSLSDKETDKGFYLKSTRDASKRETNQIFKSSNSLAVCMLMRIYQGKKND